MPYLTVDAMAVDSTARLWTVLTGSTLVEGKSARTTLQATQSTVVWTGWRLFNLVVAQEALITFSTLRAVTACEVLSFPVCQRYPIPIGKYLGRATFTVLCATQCTLDEEAPKQELKHRLYVVAHSEGFPTVPKLTMLKAKSQYSGCDNYASQQSIVKLLRDHEKTLCCVNGLKTTTLDYFRD